MFSQDFLSRVYSVIDNNTVEDTKNLFKVFSKEEYKRMLEQYYGGEKVTELIKQYDLNIVESSMLYRSMPIIYLDNKSCINCASSCICRLPSKSAGDDLIIECSNCKHSNVRYCDCEYCLQNRKIKMQLLIEKREFERQMLNEKREEAIREHLIGQSKQIAPNVESLSIRLAVYILAVYRYLYDEDTDLIDLTRAEITPLLPCSMDIEDCIDELIEVGIVHISPFSPESAFILDANTLELQGYNHFEVDLQFSFDGDVDAMQNYMAMLEKKLKSGAWLNERKVEIGDFWYELCIEECIERLAFIADEYGFRGISGAKTRQIFRDLLKQFCLGEVYNIIHYSVKRMVYDYQSKYTNIPKYQVSNMIPTKCQSYAERAIAEGWTLKPWSRDWKTPRSAVNYILHDVLLKNSTDEINLRVVDFIGEAYDKATLVG